MLPLLLIFAQTATLGADSITMEVINHGAAAGGWTLRADDSGQSFRAGPGGDAGSFVAAHGTFAFVEKRLAAYRKLSRDGTGCPVGASDMLVYRFTWISHGARRTATFSDSCGGTPEDIFVTMRPIDERLDRAIARPPGPDAPDPQ